MADNVTDIASRPRRTIVVRQARADDVDGVILTMRYAHAESDRELPPPEFPHVRDWAIKILGIGYSWIALDGDRVVGVLMTAPHHKSWSTKAVTIESLHFYVLKAYRRLPIAEQLLGKLKALADGSGLSAQLSIDYGQHAEIKDRFVGRHGSHYLISCYSNFLSESDFF